VFGLGELDDQLLEQLFPRAPRGFAQGGGDLRGGERLLGHVHDGL